MLKGKIEIHNRVSINDISKGNNSTLDLIYTPGVAFVAKEISTNKELAYDYTSKWNNVAIVCDYYSKPWEVSMRFHYVSIPRIKRR